MADNGTSMPERVTMGRGDDRRAFVGPSTQLEKPENASLRSSVAHSNVPGRTFGPATPETWNALGSRIEKTGHAGL